MPMSGSPPACRFVPLLPHPAADRGKSPERVACGCCEGRTIGTRQAFSRICGPRLPDYIANEYGCCHTRELAVEDEVDSSREREPTLRSLRLRRGESLAALARATGLERTAIVRWERGLEAPPHAALARLSAHFGVALPELASAQSELLGSGVRGEGYVTAIPDRMGTQKRALPIEPGKHRVVDLFCGSGGFSYGFEMTGKFVVTAGVDLLADRAATFRVNHAYADTHVVDIRSLSLKSLESSAGEPAVVIGGPPCQGFSSIRPFRNLTLEDPRNGLFEQFAVVVAELQPTFFVLENVLGLLTHDGGATFSHLVTILSAAGYSVDHRVVNAAQFGLPQNRERLIIVGRRGRSRFEWPMPTHSTQHRSMAGSAPRIHCDPLFSEAMPEAVTVMEAIHDLPPLAAGEASDRYLDGIDLTPYERAMRGEEARLTLHAATRHSPKMLEIIRHAGHSRAALPAGLTKSGFSSSYSRLDADKPSVTLTVNFVHPASNRCIHPTQDRALTPREGARLQGFPDRFTFVGTRGQIVKQIGNAVPPLLGRAIATAIAEQL